MVLKIENGQRFGMWTVICRNSSTRRGHRERLYLCRCDCGQERVVSGTNLARGKSTQCGRHKKFKLPPLADRFWSKVEKTDGCWRWLGNKSKEGYGKFVAPNSQLATRFSWKLHYGDIPDGMCVCHKCDNPECTRPDHLFLGTRADNNKDRAAKGRSSMANGERVPTHKLTEIKAIEIYFLYQSECYSTRDIAKVYGVSDTVVKNIGTMKAWKHIHESDPAAE